MKKQFCVAQIIWLITVALIASVTGGCHSQIPIQEQPDTEIIEKDEAISSPESDTVMVDDVTRDTPEAVFNTALPEESSATPESSEDPEELGQQSFNREEAPVTPTATPAASKPRQSAPKATPVAPTAAPASTAPSMTPVSGEQGTTAATADPSPEEQDPGEPTENGSEDDTELGEWDTEG